MCRQFCFQHAMRWSVALTLLMLAAASIEAQEKTATRSTVIGLTFQETGKGPVAIQTVEPDSLAAKMGLRPGDVIVSVDGEPVVDSAALDQLLARIEPGKKLSVMVRRGGKTEALSILVPESSVNMFGAVLDSSGGRIVVREVAPNTPAEQAGLGVGDVILTMAGQRHASLSALSEFMGKLVGGDRTDKTPEPIKVTVQRRGDEEPVALVIERETAPMPARTTPVPVRQLPARPGPARQLAFGIEVVERGTQVVITRLLENGPAAVAGMMPGDIIVAVGKKPVQSHADLVAIAANLKPGDEVPVEVARGGKTGAVAIKVVQGNPGSDDVVLAAATNQPLPADPAAPMSVEQEVRDLRARVDALEQIVARLVRELGAQRR